jgi:hypothetical protein
MRYAIIDSTNHVVNVVDWDGSASWTAPDGQTAIQSDTAQIGWTYANGTFTDPTPPYVPTQQETIDAISYVIQQSLDAGAKTWGYDSIVSAASYATDTNPQYAADAKAMIGWRSAVWAWAIPQFATIVAGADPQTFMVNMPIQPTQPVA